MLETARIAVETVKGPSSEIDLLSIDSSYDLSALYCVVLYYTILYLTIL